MGVYLTPQQKKHLSFIVNNSLRQSCLTLVLGFYRKSYKREFEQTISEVVPIHDEFLLLQVDFPPNMRWYCSMDLYVVLTSMMTGTFIILSMTFDRWFSIVYPHKASSFNTLKRAKFTLLFIIIFSVIFNLPQIYVGSYLGRKCVPFGAHFDETRVKVYYWFHTAIGNMGPFFALISMNSVIIYKVRNRAKNLNVETDKSQDAQMTALLLSVSFVFLLLTTPSQVYYLLDMYINFTKTPKDFATFWLIFNIAKHCHFSNSGVNFFLYVLSGSKFRNDLVSLVLCKQTDSAKRELSKSTQSTSG